jgi:hypothetical protein
MDGNFVFILELCKKCVRCFRNKCNYFLKANANTPTATIPSARPE